MSDTIIFDAKIKKPAPSIVHTSTKTWTTWEGNVKTVEEIDHQHLSNIYWFNIVLYNRIYLFVVKELHRRFDGELLPYIPDVRFENEIRSLEKKGFVSYINGKRILKLNNEIIGEIL